MRDGRAVGGLNVRFAIEAVLYTINCLNKESEAEIAWEIELYPSVGREKGKYVCCDYDKFFFLALSFLKKKAPKRYK